MSACNLPFLPAAGRGDVLAIDLGASGLRAARVGRDGRLGRPATVPHLLGDEADARDWWTALQKAAEATAGQGIRAICITGMTRTQVLLDAQAAPVRPALTFHDARAEGFAFNAFHPAARLLWLARHEPQSLAAATAVVDPKDYLAAQLTGRIFTDEISGSRLASASDSLAGQGVPLLLPERLASGAVIGPVQAGLPGALAALAGRPVIMAGHDTWASVLGLGAMRPGGAYSLSGTTDVLGVLGDRPAEAPGLLSDQWGPGLHHLGGPSNAGGDSLAWLMGLLAPGESAGVALARALRSPRHHQPALFLPYLNGERTPYWDPGLRGAFAGLSRQHGPADLAWAVLEGVACLNRTVLDRAEAALGPVAEIRFGGGGAASPEWRQVKADVLCRTVVAAAEPECGLLGAGIAAWTALGAHPNLAAAQDAMVRIASRHFPARDTSALFAQFRAAEAALAPISRGLCGA